MASKRPIIALCGDTKDVESYFILYKKLEETGYTVLLPSFFCWDSEEDTLEEELQAMQVCQIDKADEVFVVNKETEKNENTLFYIGYAVKTRKKLHTMNPISDEQMEKAKGRVVLDLEESKNQDEALINKTDSAVELPKAFVDSMHLFSGLIQELMLFREKNKIPKSIREYEESAEYKNGLIMIWNWLEDNNMCFLRERIETNYYHMSM